MNEEQINEDLIKRARLLMNDIEFHGYEFIVRKAHVGVVLHALYQDYDIYTCKLSSQYTRKWVLSPEMTDTEIVATAFKCAYTSFEHRCREGFKYKGARVFGPHFDIEDLVRLCKDGREDAGGRKS